MSAVGRGEDGQTLVEYALIISVCLGLMGVLVALGAEFGEFFSDMI